MSGEISIVENKLGIRDNKMIVGDCCCEPGECSFCKRACYQIDTSLFIDMFDDCDDIPDSAAPEWDGRMPSNQSGVCASWKCLNDGNPEEGCFTFTAAQRLSLAGKAFGGAFLELVGSSMRLRIFGSLDIADTPKIENWSTALFDDSSCDCEIPDDGGWDGAFYNSTNCHWETNAGVGDDFIKIILERIAGGWRLSIYMTVVGGCTDALLWRGELSTAGNQLGALLRTDGCSPDPASITIISASDSYLSGCNPGAEMPPLLYEAYAGLSGCDTPDDDWDGLGAVKVYTQSDGCAAGPATTTVEPCDGSDYQRELFGGGEWDDNQRGCCSVEFDATPLLHKGVDITLPGGWPNSRRIHCRRLLVCENAYHDGSRYHFDAATLTALREPAGPAERPYQWIGCYGHGESGGDQIYQGGIIISFWWSPDDDVMDPDAGKVIYDAITGVLGGCCGHCCVPPINFLHTVLLLLDMSKSPDWWRPPFYGGTHHDNPPGPPDIERQADNESQINLTGVALVCPDLML